MCGRYTFSHQLHLARDFELIAPERARGLPPRYNIAPSQPVPVVFLEQGKRQLLGMRWGLVPAWMKPTDRGQMPNGWINARSETIDEKPAFRGAYRYRRCLLPADGFYEWQRRDGQKTGKQAYWIHRPDRSAFAFAGLYEWWCSPDGSELPTCTVLTTQANDRLKDLHERMPVILEPEDHDRWLNPQDDCKDLMRPCDNDRIHLHPVANLVNKVANDHAGLIEPFDPSENEKPQPPQQLGLFGD